MKRITPILFLLLALVTLSGCQATNPRGPNGHYSSNNDMGVFVFRSDGVFGYKFAAKIDFYDQKDLPPERGHWSLMPDGTLEIKLYESGARKFRIEWHPEADAFDLVRLEQDGTLPMKTHYEKKG